MRQLLVCASLMVAISSAWVLAQSSSPVGAESGDPMSAFWNPQMMIERSVKQATERYHLTSEQQQLAKKMTTDGVNAFLDKHEQELRSLVGDVVRARLSGQTPTPEQAKVWSEKAYPLFEEAKKVILDGNQQFRSSLTDEQKKTFDADQKLMDRELSQNLKTVDRWRQGQFDAARDWTGQQGSQTQPGGQNRPELDRFERYARRFIENYKLDSMQATQVMGIVGEHRKRAEEYWHSHKADMETARSRVQDLSRDPKNRPQYLEATRQLSELNKPINDLYSEMRQRLDLVPTEAQRKAYNAQLEARREAWQEQMARGEPNDTAISSTSQSATSQMATSSPATRPMLGPATREGRMVTGTRPTATQAATSRPAARGKGDTVKGRQRDDVTN